MKPMLKPTLVLATIIYLIILLPSVILAPFAGFLYDSPNASGIILHIFATLWFIFPITLTISILGSWLSNVYKKEKFIGIFLIIPIIHAIMLVIFGLFHFAG